LSFLSDISANSNALPLVLTAAKTTSLSFLRLKSAYASALASFLIASRAKVLFFS